jgi:NDP-sugar pyrophosphorylase family protein
VEVAGRTLLEITLNRLQNHGVSEVIVNVHHFAEMVIDYLKAKNNFGIRIEVSREAELLDTGGGLKKAAWFFQEDSSKRDEPFILHNVDILTTIDLSRMVDAHRGDQALATLAVQNRETSRYLIFDEQGQLCGRRAGHDQPAQMARGAAQAEALAFSGVHVIAGRLLPLITENGPFSIINAYLRLAAEGHSIRGFCADQYYWIDLGRPQNVTKAAEDIRDGAVRSNEIVRETI